MGFYLPAAAVVVLDQITKQVLWRNGEIYSIIDGFLRITLVKNAGAAFGLFQGARLFFIIASVVAAIFIIYVAVRLPQADRARRLYLGLILGGAIGNLIDRTLFGEVIDFIEIGFMGHYWPVFNVADMGVSIGAVLLLLFLLRHPSEPAAVPATDGAEVVDGGQAVGAPADPTTPRDG